MSFFFFSSQYFRVFAYIFYKIHAVLDDVELPKSRKPEFSQDKYKEKFDVHMTQLKNVKDSNHRGLRFIIRELWNRARFISLLVLFLFTNVLYSENEPIISTPIIQPGIDFANIPQI